jgi:hypothetical protein
MTDNFDDLRDPKDPNDPGNSGGSGNTGDPGGSNDPFAFDDLSSFDEPTFRDPGADEDLPDELGPAEPVERSRSFIIGLFALVALLVVGLILILFAAAQIGRDRDNFQKTAVAIELTNNFINTSFAATATAKSWTLTPSNTPLPTFTPTFTPSLTPSFTPTYTVTPSATFSGTPPPSETPTETPSVTLTPSQTLEVLQGTAAALNTQAAQLQLGLTAVAAQQDANAQRTANAPTLRALSTQNAQFNQFQTFAVDQLTAIPATLTAVYGGGGAAPGVIPTASPTPSPVVTPLPPAGTPLGAVRPASRNMSSLAEPIFKPKRQDEATATVEAIFTQIGQLEAAGTANAFQATLNAQIYAGTYPPFVQTQLAQINAGGTAVSLQLTLNARLLTGTPQRATATPKEITDAGLFDDLGGGALSGAGLAIFGIAALGLILVIAVSRRMRVQE